MSKVKIHYVITLDIEENDHLCITGKTDKQVQDFMALVKALRWHNSNIIEVLDPISLAWTSKEADVPKAEIRFMCPEPFNHMFRVQKFNHIWKGEGDFEQTNNPDFVRNHAHFCYFLKDCRKHGANVAVFDDANFWDNWDVSKLQKCFKS